MQPACLFLFLFLANYALCTKDINNSDNGRNRVINHNKHLLKNNDNNIRNLINKFLTSLNNLFFDKRFFEFFYFFFIHSNIFVFV